MKRLLLNYSIPLILVAVAVIQFYHVKTYNLTAWKGGGFGMYSAIFWSNREVWFFGLNENINPFDGFEMEVDHVRQYPSDKNIRGLAEKVKNKYNVPRLTVEVWDLRCSEDGTLSKIMLNKIDVP